MQNEEIIKKHLKNEKILWQGHPFKTPLFNKSDILLIPLTAIIGGFLIFYAVMSAILMINGKSAMFPLVGITFLLIGVYVLFFRFFYRKKRINSQRYFVTEKRVFAFDTMRYDVLFDLSLADICPAVYKNTLFFSDTNPSGDIIYDLGLDIFLRKFIKETPSFKYIKSTDEVLNIIKTAKTGETADDSLFI